MNRTYHLHDDTVVRLYLYAMLEAELTDDDDLRAAARTLRSQHPILGD